MKENDNLEINSERRKKDRKEKSMKKDDNFFELCFNWIKIKLADIILEY